MPNITKFTLTVLLIVSVLRIEVLSKEITFATDAWCPYICELDAQQPGILVESIKQILATSSYQPIFQRVDWARSLKAVRSGELDSLVGTYISDAPDFIYGKNSFMTSEMCFFTKHDDSWEYKGMLTLNARRIVFLNGYSYGAIFDNYILNNENVGERNLVRMNGVDAEGRRISLLEKKWADTVIEDKYVFRHMLKMTNKAGQFREAGCLKGQAVHVAFSPRNEQSLALAQLISEGIGKMKSNGEFEKITQRYITTP